MNEPATEAREPAADPRADALARMQALDPERSFIVQAPAGSGKTELLIQRYLVLLARVQSPEEIAAITFTKKAAAEMRKRVLEALAQARDPVGQAREPLEQMPPPRPHAALTLEHARAVLRRDSALGWRLEENAARLRIQTIDALCASLTRQMPVLATFGAQPQSVEDAEPLYRAAARATLALLEDKGAAHARVADDVAKLLTHLDNNVAVAEDLIAGMLRKRDHWLRNLRSADDRAALEAALGSVRREAMARLRTLVPAAEAGELLALATYAAENLAAGGKESPVRECADLAALPGTREADAYAWLGLAEMLLTAAGEWRKAANVNLGFPAGEDKAGKVIAKQWKQRHAEAIARLASEPLREALEGLRRLPPARYTDAQWETLGAIARLLPLAVAQLKIVFAARGEADFVEIAQGALAALGAPDAPTDLLLSLDYRIHHILVDEFQDTSFTQFELLEKLTSGWGMGGEQDDDRTLFLVGDPMQSIYRFREAEVGLFLKARSAGIGQVALEPLTLTANFRSQAGIVDWVNRAFVQVMPQSENVAAGAVRYSPSDPVHPAQKDAVRVHAFFNGEAQSEAQQVASLIETARAEMPDGTLAVLVRSRSHLQDIVPRLKARGLSFRAIEIEQLGHRQVVQDLLALTRALAHPADRAAWLAILRAPWCGLTLADLHALAGADARGAMPEEQGRTGVSGQLSLFGEAVAALPESGGEAPATARDQATIWEGLQDHAQLARLCAEGRARIERVRGALTDAMSRRLRGSLRDRVESAWLALGGPACVEDGTDLEDAEVYLDYLEQSEQAGEIAEVAVLEQGLAKLYALPDLQADPKTAVQVMTIHKSKGLEFDTVILPGLGRAPRKRDSSLFLWTETPMGIGERGALLLAPIKATGTESDMTYDYLVRLDAQKESHEDGRLLYVAATRARRHLHLLGDTRLAAAGAGETELKPPNPASLLAKLWPAVEADFAETARQLPAAGQNDAPSAPAGPGPGGSDMDQDLRRLPGDWIFPEAPCAVSWPGSAAEDGARARDPIEFSWVGETARHVGSVVHRWLQRIAEDQMQGWSRARIENMRDALRDELAARGVEHKEQPAAVERVARALANSLEDPRGKWLLGPQSEARNEYRLTALIDGERRNLVIDRTFRDAEGRRWIVDYKTSGHEGAGLDVFLDRERARYTAQLERYARVLAHEAHSSLGLYFPLMCGWRDWPSGSGD